MKTKALLLALALFLVSASALAEVEKDEIIYARLDATGGPESTYVVNAFSADEAGSYEDYGDYSSAVSLTPGLTATLADGAVALELPAGRSYYQAAPDALALPWTISVRYMLDGAAVDASALSGASGYLQIEISVQENDAAADGWYDAYTLQVTATLDASLCDNLSAEGATVVSAGSDYTASWIVTPGSGTTLALEADIQDFKMDPIQFAGVRLDVTLDDSAFSDTLDAFAASASTLSTGAASLATSLSDAGDAADTLYESAGTLADSMEAFQEKLSGMDELSVEFAALLTGYQEVVSGIDSLATGIDTAATSAKQVSATASMFAAGIGKVDIGAMVKNAFGGDFEMHSYLSDHNADTRSVQFVLMTPGID